MTIKDAPKFILPLNGVEDKFNKSFTKQSSTTVPRVNKTNSRCRLISAAIAGNLLYLSTGCIIAWVSPTENKLKESIGLTEDQASWIGSLYALGAVLGPALSALCLDSVGRKGTMLITALIFLVSWIIIGVASTITVIFVGRIVGGIAVGASFACVSVYIAEISDNDIRGALGSVNQMFVGMGLMVQYCVGPYVSYEALVGVSASIAVVFIAVILMVPESPYYLMSKNRKQEAVKALCWLRGNLRPPLVQREINSIEETLTESKKIAGKKSDLFLKRGPRRALLICLWSMLTQQISGINVVLSFSEPIFQMAHLTFKPEYSSMLVGGVNVIAAGFAPPLVKILGLKLVLIGTSFIMAFCQMALSLFFYLQSHNSNTINLDWLPIGSLMIFCIAFCIGIGPLPWTSVAELFPSELKGFASCLIGAYVWLISFTVMKSYENILNLFGSTTVFLFFGVAEFIGAIFMCFIQPNTKNFSFQEIQDLLNGTPSPVTLEESDKESIG